MARAFKPGAPFYNAYHHEKENQPRSPAYRDNPVAQALETTTKLADENTDLNRHIRELEDENEALQDKLDEIADIVECDDSECSAENHLEDIAEIVAKGSRDTGED